MTVKRKAPAADRVRASVAATIPAAPDARYVLAVSGGRDSMVLLDAFASARSDIAAVATFNHGTGDAATRAAEHVELEAARRGLPCVSGHAAAAAAAAAVASPSEDTLRTERWAFLRAWAEEFNATVVTAHTEDDQVETVFMRIMRDSGARGLAGMFAPSGIGRPLLGVSRADVGAYAELHGVRWIEDPSNASTRYLRNRVRAELLPAILAVHPHFRTWLLHVARDAATWRSSVAAIVTALGVIESDPAPPADLRATEGGAASRTAVVPATALAGLGPEELAVVWPEIAGRAGVALDWRGVERLARESATLKPGGVVQLSGGSTVNRTVGSFVIRNSGPDSRLY